MKTNTEKISMYSQAFIKSYEDLSSKKCFKINLKRIHSLGDIAKEITPSLTIIKDDLLDKNSGLYELVNLASNNKWGKIANEINSTKKKISNAPIDLNNVGLSHIIMPEIPYEVILMCGVLVTIEESLAVIAQSQNQIYSFLERDKESEIEGDINVLNNFLKEYKHNYMNNDYIKTHVGMVLDIKRSSMQKIVFYQKEVDTIINKKHTMVFSNNIKHIFDNLNHNLSYYRLSIYSFAYSTLLEVILNKNFKEEYLNEVKITIDSAINNYLSLINKAKEMSTTLSGGSVEKKVGITFSNTTSKIGKLFNKNKVDEEPKQKEAKEDQVLINEISALDSFANHNCETFLNTINNLSFIFTESSRILINSEEIVLI